MLMAITIITTHDDGSFSFFFFAEPHNNIFLAVIEKSGGRVESGRARGWVNPQQINTIIIINQKTRAQWWFFLPKFDRSQQSFSARPQIWNEICTDHVSSFKNFISLFHNNIVGRTLQQAQAHKWPLFNILFEICILATICCAKAYWYVGRRLYLQYIEWLASWLATRSLYNITRKKYFAWTYWCNVWPCDLYFQSIISSFFLWRLVGSLVYLLDGKLVKLYLLAWPGLALFPLASRADLLLLAFFSSDGA